jgi:DNA-directed RNA polymerase subunit RPC12/RpoP
MAASSSTGAHAIVCPHCGKEFEAELLTGVSDRHQGFKCPHCRLFIAYSRVEDHHPEDADADDGQGEGRVTR